jgi:hypothetical protein
MRARTVLWLFVGCIVLGGIGTRAFAVTDDMEQDLWTLGHVNGTYDGTATAEYSTADAVSPTHSIHLSLSGGGTSGHDGDAVFAVRQFAGNLLGRRLQVKYNIAQQTDGDGWGGMHGSADVIVSVLDATGMPLGSWTYRLACSDLHEVPSWYAHMGGDAGSPCHKTGNITYIGTPDAGGEYEPGPGWQTLDVAPAENMLVDWTRVTTVQVKLVVDSCFMHLDTFEVFFDDLNLTPIPATVDIDPNTLNFKSQGKWITAYITLPEGYDVGDIDISSIQLDGIAAAWGNDCEDDAIMVKFDRDAVIAYLKDKGLALPAEVTLTVTGDIGALTFEGSDTIRVIEPPKPPAGPKGGKGK